MGDVALNNLSNNFGIVSSWTAGGCLKCITPTGTATRWELGGFMANDNALLVGVVHAAVFPSPFRVP